MPVIFAAHGAPVLLDDAVWMAELAAWAKAMPKPKSILMVSAHWEQRPTTLGATRHGAARLRLLRVPGAVLPDPVPVPGRSRAGRSRARAARASGTSPSSDDPERGLDHGAYVPLVAMYPDADVPVLQVSMPALDPEELFALGRALAPLRDEGVLVFGSGFLTHNMRYAFRPGIPSWAREFDAWAADALLTVRRGRAPGFPRARAGGPTWRCRRGSTTRRCSCAAGASGRDAARRR